MSYLTNMMMLLINAMDDEGMQARIDMARVECGANQSLQRQLDHKQTALDEVRQRNYERIAELARLN